MSAIILPIFTSITKVIYRETFSNYYKSLLFPLSILIVECLWMIPLSLIAFIPHYFIIGLNSDPEVFFSQWLTTYVYCIFFTQFALCLSLSLPLKFTETLQNMYISLVFSFGNIAITYPQTNKICRFFMRLLPMYYVNRAITTQQFKNRFEIITVYLNDQSVTTTLRDFVTMYTGYHFDSTVFWWSLLWLFVMIGIFISISLLGSTFVRWK
jgi:hypothetical protein